MAKTKTTLPYKVICISLYREDLKALDQMVENLKGNGVTRANRSALIRYALAKVNLGDATTTFLAAR